MNAIYQIKQKLTKHPTVQYTESPGSITVLPADASGFPVALRVHNDSFTVYFEGWHESFEFEDDALNYFAFGLSEACRLAVVYHGSTPTKWTVECEEKGTWLEESTTGLLFVPFWRARRLAYKQNRLLPAPTESGDAA